MGVRFNDVTKTFSKTIGKKISTVHNKISGHRYVLDLMVLQWDV